MTDQEKLAKLEEMMELDEGTLAAETVLSSLDEWDSLAKLSLIVLVDDEFGKHITGDEVRKFVKVSEILAIMG